MTHPYNSATYAKALIQEGTLLFFEPLECWIERRPIPGTPYFDAKGLYPFTSLKLPSSSRTQHATLRELGLISLVLVTDAVDIHDNSHSAPFDLVKPYKTHYQVTHNSTENIFSKHHRREIKLAKQTCTTKVISLSDYLDAWMDLYETLIKRHSLSGIHLFSREYFEYLASQQNFITIAAFVNGRLVSAHIWLKHQDHVYSHLAASNETGYAHRASYAIYQFSISYFAQSRIIDLGGGPDHSKSPSGLTKFKKGFANQSNSNMICGIIAEPEIYQSICNQSPFRKSTGYFPAYRST